MLLALGMYLQSMQAMVDFQQLRFDESNAKVAEIYAEGKAVLIMFGIAVITLSTLVG